MTATPIELDDALSVYVDHLRVERGLSDNSLAAYHRDLSKLVAYLEARGETAPEAVTRDHLLSFLVHLGRTGLANRSVARHVSSVRGFFQFLLEDGHVIAGCPTYENSSHHYTLLSFCAAACEAGLVHPDLLPLEGG